MTKEINNSAKAPAAIGPYSHSIKTDNLLFVSGQLGLDPASGTLKEDVVAQAKQGFENLTAILNEGGFELADVVKTTVFLADMADFKAVNEVYADYFGDWKPTRSAIAVAALPMGALFEIEAIASK